MTVASSTATADRTAPPPPPRRGRWLRRLGFALGIPLLLVAIAPHAVALDAVRSRIEEEASDVLQVPVRIGRLGFSWFTGFAVRDLEIANPPGYTTDRPALRLRRAALELPVAALLRREVTLVGTLDGLVLEVELDAEGVSNLETLGRRAAGRDEPDPPDPPGPPSPPSSRSGNPLTALRCDLRLTDNTIVVCRYGRQLLAGTMLQGTVVKPRGSDVLQAELTTTLANPEAAAPSGRLTATVHSDLRAIATTATVQVAGVELAALQPLLAAVTPAPAATCAGRVDGGLQATLRAGTTTLAGELVVTGLQLAGAPFAGHTLRTPRATLQPALRHDAKRLDTTQLRLDLGWARLWGEPADQAATAQFGWALDLDACAAANDGLPAWLRGSGANAAGTIAFASAALRGDTAAFASSLLATATLQVPRATCAGLLLRDVVVDARLDGTGLDATTRDGAHLADGPVQLTLHSELGTATQPTTLRVRWRDGALRPGATGALRWIVPLYAGLGETAPVDGRGTLDLTASGPAPWRDDENWLQWLDRWSGQGRFVLHDGSVAPAAGLAGLRTPLGALGSAFGSGLGTTTADGARLVLDTLDVPFRFAAGAISTTAGSWLAAGRRIGLSGTVRLDGRLDYAFDLAALLQGHRDGDRVLQALGGQLPPARLRGTLDAPTLALPDLAAALQRLAERELQQRGGDLLRREIERLLGPQPRR